MPVSKEAIIAIARLWFVNVLATYVDALTLICRSRCSYSAVARGKRVVAIHVLPAGYSDACVDAGV